MDTWYVSPAMIFRCQNVLLKVINRPEADSFVGFLCQNILWSVNFISGSILAADLKNKSSCKIPKKVTNSSKFCQFSKQENQQHQQRFVNP